MSMNRWAFGLVLLAVAATIPLAAEAQTPAAPLAIKGYDPVAYFIESRPVAGKPEFEYPLDEVRYRFASAANLQRFKSAPDSYVPRFAGFCAMSISNGREVAADPNNWLIHEGKLYVFAMPEAPAKFRQNLGESVAKANQHWAVLRPAPK